MTCFSQGFFVLITFASRWPLDRKWNCISSYNTLSLLTSPWAVTLISHEAHTTFITNINYWLSSLLYSGFGSPKSPDVKMSRQIYQVLTIIQCSCCKSKYVILIVLKFSRRLLWDSRSLYALVSTQQTGVDLHICLLTWRFKIL